jgi:hypothetical protein
MAGEIPLQHFGLVLKIFSAALHIKCPSFPSILSVSSSVAHFPLIFSHFLCWHSSTANLSAINPLPPPFPPICGKGPAGNKSNLSGEFPFLLLLSFLERANAAILLRFFLLPFGHNRPSFYPSPFSQFFIQRRTPPSSFSD